MKLFGAVVGAGIGSLLGAVFMIVFSYALGYEPSWSVWLVGVFAAGGAKLGISGQRSIPAASITLLLAILGIALGKYASVQLLIVKHLDPKQIAIASIANVIVAESEESGQAFSIGAPLKASSLRKTYSPEIWSAASASFDARSLAQQQALLELPRRANPQYIFVFIADEMAQQALESGKQLSWPEGASPSRRWRQRDYPSDLWHEAESYFNDMNPDQRKAYVDSVDAFLLQKYQAERQTLAHATAISGYAANLGTMDLLWLALALGIAFAFVATGEMPSELEG